MDLLHGCNNYKCQDLYAPLFFDVSPLVLLVAVPAAFTVDHLRETDSTAASGSSPCSVTTVALLPVLENAVGNILGVNLLQYLFIPN